MKLRKSQMKLRKNEIVSPKNSTVSRWKMKNPHGGILDSLRGDSIGSLITSYCCPLLEQPLEIELPAIIRDCREELVAQLVFLLIRLIYI